MKQISAALGTVKTKPTKEKTMIVTTLIQTALFGAACYLALAVFFPRQCEELLFGRRNNRRR